MYPAYPPSGPLQVSVFNSSIDPSFFPPQVPGPPLFALATTQYWYSSAANTLFGNPLIGSIKSGPMIEILSFDIVQHAGTLGATRPEGLPLLWGPSRGFLLADPGGSSLT